MIPHRAGVDSTAALLRHGYPFISQTCDRLGADAFRTRLLGRRVVCARGVEAARAFYTADRFTRRDAMPSSTLHLLQDLGSVQTLDGAEHRHRKALFLAAAPQDDASALVTALAEHWGHAVRQWSQRDRVVLLPQVERVLTATALQWAGIPPDGTDVDDRATELAAMVRYSGSAGPPNWWARMLRRRSEGWAAGRVQAARDGRSPCPPGSPLDILISHRDGRGDLLDPAIAAVELLNLLRPVVAVGRFIVFVALSLLRNPQWRKRFGEGDENDLSGFVQEVRRFYPFFPLIGGRVLEPFSFSGHHFGAGDWMVLDLYGTNHDARLWPQPEEFHPERFRDWDGDPNTLIPQGGGDVATGHRCPGENATIALMTESVRLLTRGMRYDVPVQDLHVDLRRMPAQPHDGFAIAHVRPA